MCLVIGWWLCCGGEVRMGWPHARSGLAWGLRGRGCRVWSRRRGFLALLGRPGQPLVDPRLHIPEVGRRKAPQVVFRPLAETPAFPPMPRWHRLWLWLAGRCGTMARTRVVGDSGGWNGRITVWSGSHRILGCLGTVSHGSGRRALFDPGAGSGAGLLQLLPGWLPLLEQGLEGGCFDEVDRQLSSLGLSGMEFSLADPKHEGAAVEVVSGYRFGDGDFRVGWHRLWLGSLRMR